MVNVKAIQLTRVVDTTIYRNPCIIVFGREESGGEGGGYTDSTAPSGSSRHAGTLRGSSIVHTHSKNEEKGSRNLGDTLSSHIRIAPTSKTWASTLQNRGSSTNVEAIFAAFTYFKENAAKQNIPNTAEKRPKREIEIIMSTFSNLSRLFPYEETRV